MTQRTPFIAGNWKMHKTVARGGGVHPGAAAARRGVDGVDVAICVPFTALQAAASTRRAARASRSSRRTCTRRAEGAFTGEVCAPMLAELDVARRRARPLRAPPATSARPTARCAREGPGRARRRACTPILCVGETEEERERGDTERKLRHQVQEASTKLSPTSASATSSIAYEPIWAIGTGQGRDARAGAGGDRVRARARRRPRPRSRPSACASSTAAASSPTTPPSCSRCPTSTARSSAAPRSTPTSFAAIVEAAAGLTARERAGPVGCLVVLDGWGLAPSRARATPSRSPTRRSSTTLWARYPHTTLTACGERGRPARRADGQQRGRPPQPRRRRGRQAGPHAHRRGGRGRHAGRERGAARARCADAERVHLIGLVERRRRALGLEAPARR